MAETCWRWRSVARSALPGGARRRVAANYLFDFEFCAGVGVGVSADPNLEIAGLGDLLHFLIVEREVVGREFEGDVLRFAGGDRDALDAFELADRPVDVANHIADVELHDFGAGVLAGVLDVGGDFDCVTEFDLVVGDFDVAVGERRVREAEAEGKLRLEAEVEVVGGVAERALPGADRNVVDRRERLLFRRAAGVRVVVVDRNLGGRLGPGDGESTAGLGVAEEDVGHGGAAPSCRDARP